MSVLSIEKLNSLAGHQTSLLQQLISRQEYQQAYSFYEQILQPKAIHHYYGGVAYLLDEQFIAAERSLNEALGFGFVAAVPYLASLYRRTERWNKAAGILEAFQDVPSDPYTQLAIAYEHAAVLSRAEMYMAACSRYEQAWKLAQHPQNRRALPNTTENYAQALYFLGHDQKALDILDQFLVDPKQAPPSLIHQRSRSLLRTGDASLALELLNSLQPNIAELAPDLRVRILTTKALAHIQLYEWVEADRSLRSARNLSDVRTETEFHWHLAWMQYAAHCPEVALHPSIVEHHHKQAKALLPQLGQRDLAYYSYTVAWLLAKEPAKHSAIAANMFTEAAKLFGKLYNAREAALSWLCTADILGRSGQDIDTEAIQTALCAAEPWLVRTDVQGILQELPANSPIHRWSLEQRLQGVLAVACKRLFEALFSKMPSPDLDANASDDEWLGQASQLYPEDTILGVLLLTVSDEPVIQHYCKALLSGNHLEHHDVPLEAKEQALSLLSNACIQMLENELALLELTQQNDIDSSGAKEAPGDAEVVTTLLSVAETLLCLRLHQPGLLGITMLASLSHQGMGASESLLGRIYACELRRHGGTLN
jgi:hypothetical protein